jgi:hypothetical protein
MGLNSGTYQQSNSSWLLFSPQIESCKLPYRYPWIQTQQLKTSAAVNSRRIRQALLWYEKKWAKMNAAGTDANKKNLGPQN